MAENLAIRLRKGGKLASNLSLYAGAASTSEYSSVKVSRNIEATQNTKELQDLAISLFREKYQGGAIRQIGISGNQLLIVLLNNSLYLKVFKKIKLIKSKNHSKKLLMRLEKLSIFFQYKRQVVYPRVHVSFIGTNSLEVMQQVKTRR